LEKKEREREREKKKVVGSSGEEVSEESEEVQCV